jgi:hypothetical protein
MGGTLLDAGASRADFKPTTVEILERLETVLSTRAEKILFIKADPDVSFATLHISRRLVQDRLESLQS